VQRDSAEENTAPVAVPDGFHRYLAQHKLTWVEVARASGVPCLTVWSIDHGLMVNSIQAALVRRGLKKLTGGHFNGCITARSAGKQP
jgi:hypothetical protein